MKPAGTIRICLTDWCKFVQAYLNGSQGSSDYLKSRFMLQNATRNLHSVGQAVPDIASGNAKQNQVRHSLTYVPGLTHNRH